VIFDHPYNADSGRCRGCVSSSIAVRRWPGSVPQECQAGGPCRGDTVRSGYRTCPGVAADWGVSVEAEPGSNLLPNLVMASARPASRMRP
jgi:hypothetical protein